MVSVNDFVFSEEAIINGQLDGKPPFSLEGWDGKPFRMRFDKQV